MCNLHDNCFTLCRMSRHTEVKFNHREVQLYRKKPLGAGSYGSVFRALCDELPCAAKILHPLFFQFDDPGSSTVLKRFHQECEFLNAIRHPNIVQYLGTYQDPETKLPVLLMELMDESLTKFLERTNTWLLPYHTEVGICHDIVLALSYLHSNSIIHRDLSSNNVLLIAGSRAKLTDFGMAKLVEVNPRMTPLTQCPGSEVYMSPESLRNPPLYTEKLDSFSFGVLSIQTLTHSFPSPAPPRQILKDSRYPTGKIEVPVPEVERRKEHIQLINSTHPLLPIAMSCLIDDEQKRPSASELCRSIAALKETHLYEQSVYKQQIVQQTMFSKASSASAPDVVSVEQKNEPLSSQDDRLKQLDGGEEKMKEKFQELSEKLMEKDKQIEELQQKLQLHESSKPTEVSVAKFNLQWKTQRNAPCEMSRGTVAVEGNVAYFASVSSNKMYSYTIDEGKWCSSFPECPHVSFRLVVLKNMPTAVGGVKSGVQTNVLLSLVVDGHDRKWRQIFPPFPTKRYSPAVACCNGYLVVAGGKFGMSLRSAEKSIVVEVMSEDGKQWHTAASLPYPVCCMTATLCGDTLYLAGGFNKDGESKSVISCSFSALLQSCQRPNSLMARIKGTSGVTNEIWQNCPIPDVPVWHAKIETLRDEVIAVGSTLSVIPSTEVWMYDATMGSWLKISQVPTARDWSLVAALPEDRLIVIGGSLQSVSSSGYTDIVEIASVC